MKKIVLPILVMSVTVLGGNSIFAKQRAPAIMADEAAPEPPDPKKKKPGEACTSHDECQKHHNCKKDGDKGICTAPPRPKLPPGVVT